MSADTFTALISVLSVLLVLNLAATVVLLLRLRVHVCTGGA